MLSLFRWFWPKPKPVTLNRADRRALNRLSRPPRGVLEPVVARLRRLPIRDRLQILDSLPAAQRIMLEDRL